MLVGAVALLPASLAFETWQVPFALRFFVAFGYSAVVSGVVATMIWFVLVRRIGATRAATFHFLNPFLGVAIAAAVLGERVTARDLAGVAIIMAGILAVQLARAGDALRRSGGADAVDGVEGLGAERGPARRRGTTGQPGWNSDEPRPKPSAPAAHQAAKSAGPTPPTA